jgi:hypothetical protein
MTEKAENVAGRLKAHLRKEGDGTVVCLRLCEKPAADHTLDKLRTHGLEGVKGGEGVLEDDPDSTSELGAKSFVGAQRLKIPR